MVNAYYFKRGLMKIFYLLLLLLAMSCSENKKEPLAEVKNFISLQADSLDFQTSLMLKDVERDDVEKTRLHFRAARSHYKQLEGLVGFYFPGMEDVINGPAIETTEEYDDAVIEPTGFQVIEELLFSDPDTVLMHELESQLKIFSAALIRLKQLIATNDLSDSNVFEAMRLEVLRVMSLGISGFDSPVALESVPEATAALTEMEQILSFYKRDGDNEMEWIAVSDILAQSKQYLEDHADFNSFNRMEFITDYLNPLSSSLLAYQNASGIPNNRWLTAIDPDKGHYFEEGVFNVEYFAPGYNREHTPQMIQLGKILFFDPVLSGNNSRSCASCHRPEKAFTDGIAKSVAFNAEGEVARNAPTLINSGFQQSLFWDQRVHFLEDQITDVVSNPHEMHGQMAEASEKIMESAEYRVLFERAFGRGEQQINPRNIQAALAWYIRSLTGMNSKFDQYMRGDHSVMTEKEIAGFNLFMGKAKCGTCHFMPLFNGSVPPMYSETESEILGVPESPDTVDAKIDKDLGKFFAFNKDIHKYAFKTPTVRNAALTAPYMHNGVFASLEEVVDFYNRGGGAGIGSSLAHQTLPPDLLHLTEEEQEQIIAFIHTLSDTTHLSDIPDRLPAFSDPALQFRKVGGKY